MGNVRLIEVEAESVEQAIKMMNRDEDRDGNEFLPARAGDSGSFMVMKDTQKRILALRKPPCFSRGYKVKTFGVI